MKNNTATGTTATAEVYRGRFAPSPTGLLHQGSLLVALGSWLDARAHGGRWLVRLEDLDRPRTIAGAAESILRTLELLGLTADEPVLRQSAREDAYQLALSSLHEAGWAYRCTCTRSELSGAYPGLCRGHPPPPGPAAWRLKLPQGMPLEFADLFQGHQAYNPMVIGDPVIFRRDGVAAYQLAVVVDDAFQGITHVVRGADLLESTAWQIGLFQALQRTAPRFGHLPLVQEPDGSKLSKSRGAQAVSRWAPGEALEKTLILLGYQPPAAMAREPVQRTLDWALAGWPPAGMAGRRAITLAT